MDWLPVKVSAHVTTLTRVLLQLEKYLMEAEKAKPLIEEFLDKEEMSYL